MGAWLFKNFVLKLCEVDLSIVAMSQIASLDYHILTALIAASVSLLVAIPTSFIAVFKHLNEGTLTRKTERAINRLLRAEHWSGRPFRWETSSLESIFVPFRVIRHHIGGYKDDDLRQLLVRCGAIRFADQNMVEHWALLSRIPRKLRKRPWEISATSEITPPPSELFPQQDSNVQV